MMPIQGVWDEREWYRAEWHLAANELSTADRRRLKKEWGGSYAKLMEVKKKHRNRRGRLEILLNRLDCPIGHAVSGIGGRVQERVIWQMNPMESE